jgi:hypothetical protein
MARSPHRVVLGSLTLDTSQFKDDVLDINNVESKPSVSIFDSLVAG